MQDPENDAKLGVEPLCTACNDMYTIDTLRGNQAFELTRKPPRLLCSLGYPRYNEGTPFKKVRAMPRISMLTFAKFCAARKDASARRIVHDSWEQEKNPEYIYYRDYYRPLRDAIHSIHFETGDIDALEEALPSLPRDPKLADRRQQTRETGRAYLALWRTQGFRYFAVGAPIDIDISGLVVRVNPELGIRTVFDDIYVVKLWFSGSGVSQQVRETLFFLMDRAQDRGLWPESASPRIWDIRRRLLHPASPSPGKDLRPFHNAKAEWFRDIWKTLEV